MQKGKKCKKAKENVKRKKKEKRKENPIVFTQTKRSFFIVKHIAI